MDQTDGQVRLLAEDGTLVEHDTYRIDLSDDQLRDLYRQLVVVRRIDVEGTNLQRQGQLGIWAPLLGQEAAQVGSAWPSAPTTSSSPPTASTASPTAAGWIRCGCSACSAVLTRAPGTRR